MTLKSLNQKIRRVARKYGTNSPAYQNFVTTMGRNFETHLTKDGVIQINNIKKPNKYQQQQLEKLSVLKGIKELETAARKRLQKKGIAKPKQKQIEEEVKTQFTREKEFDETLTIIYDEIQEGSLPVDIYDRQNKLHRHGKGAGMGVTTDDVDYIIKKTSEWKILKEELNVVAQDISKLPEIDTGIQEIIWNSERGRYTVDEIRQNIETLKRYLTKELEKQNQ